jgi:hypothetical protein
MSKETGSVFHCAECQEAHFELTFDSWLKRELAELKAMDNKTKDAMLNQLEGEK